MKRNNQNQYLKDAKGMLNAHNLGIAISEENILLLASALRAADKGDMVASHKLIDTLLAQR